MISLGEVWLTSRHSVSREGGLVAGVGLFWNRVDEGSK